MLADYDADAWLVRPWPEQHGLHPLDAAWIEQLDHDLERAQAMLRVPIVDRPWPGATTAPRTEPPPPPAYRPPTRRREQPSGPKPETLVAPEGGRLMGAYARRAKQQ